MSCGDLTVFKHSLPISHFFCRTIITLSLASLSVCNIIWFNLNPLCFHDLALLPGEKPPDPTVPVPKEASDNEEENSVEIQIRDMTLLEVTALKRKLLNYQSMGRACYENYLTAVTSRVSLGLLSRNVWV